MRIAHIAPLYESVPPQLYGGTERIVAYLADAQVDLGHEVSVFASGDSRTRAKLLPSRARAIRLDPEPLKSDLAAHLAMLHEVRRRAGEFDMLHFHVDLLHFPLFENIAERTLTTLHGRQDLAGLAEVYRCWPRYPLVSISDQQRHPLRFANWVGTVHHGLPTDLLTPLPAPLGGYLAFLGRMSPEKRPDRAIAIARGSGRRLKMAAKVDVVDAPYYRERIEPLLVDESIEFIGEIDEVGKRSFLGNADALLFPIDWPEPFGLVMIEAMACGTPVIAWDCGSVREVIDDGVTGFIVNSEQQALDAVARLPELDRSEIRRAFERRFSAPVMAQRYLDLYRVQGASPLPTQDAVTLLSA
jgi:glycosyltransferase involved in cell wall biosynthesis